MRVEGSLSGIIISERANVSVRYLVRAFRAAGEDLESRMAGWRRVVLSDADCCSDCVEERPPRPRFAGGGLSSAEV